MILGGRISLLAKIPLDKPPDALEAQARDILEKIGHAGLRADSTRGFIWDNAHFEEVRRNGAGADRWGVFTVSRPLPIAFWYKQSPRPLLPWSMQNATSGDPPLTITGIR